MIVRISIMKNSEMDKNLFDRKEEGDWIIRGVETHYCDGVVDFLRKKGWEVLGPFDPFPSGWGNEYIALTYPVRRVNGGWARTSGFITWSARPIK